MAKRVFQMTTDWRIYLRLFWRQSADGMTGLTAFTLIPFFAQPLQPAKASAPMAVTEGGMLICSASLLLRASSLPSSIANTKTPPESGMPQAV